MTPVVMWLSSLALSKEGGRCFVVTNGKQNNHVLSSRTPQ